MEISSLQDKLTRGMGAAARKLGVQTTVYRPLGPSQPLGAHRRVITMLAAFEPRGQMSGGSSVVSPVWHGVFDASYTQQADYLVSKKTTFFVGSQVAGLPILCILTNRVVCMSRPTFVAQGGYSGFSPSDSQATLVDWPASVIQPSGGTSASVSGSYSLGSWTVLLPVLPVAPHAGDVITDDLGSAYAVNAAEENSLGWCLHVRQIGA